MDKVFFVTFIIVWFVGWIITLKTVFNDAENEKIKLGVIATGFGALILFAMWPFTLYFKEREKEQEDRENKLVDKIVKAIKDD